MFLLRPSNHNLMEDESPTLYMYMKHVNRMLEHASKNRGEKSRRLPSKDCPVVRKICRQALTKFRHCKDARDIFIRNQLRILYEHNAPYYIKLLAHYRMLTLT